MMGTHFDVRATAAVGPSSSLRRVDHVVELAEIFDPDVNVVTLRRPLGPALLEEARWVVASPGLREQFSVDACPSRRAPGGVPDALLGLLHIAADAQLWFDVLADLTGCDRIGVRLARLDTAMCPRFHVDRVTLRIVVTYAGRGTEYVSSGDVDRRRLGHAAEGAPDERSGLLLSTDCVRAAETGDVVLLKGEAWPENAGRGAVHRSPATDGGSPRLVMTLDPL